MSVPFPEGKFGAILADPPWRYLTWSAKGRDRCPEARSYQTMPFEDLKELPVTNLAAKDCVLFLWVVDWLPPECVVELLKAWDFKYSTKAFCWVKCKASGAEHMTGGYWARGNPEDCLLAVRGHPKRLDKGVRKLIYAPAREPGRKPDEQYSRIERLVSGPYCELFSRTTYSGNWTVWGDQCAKFAARQQALALAEDH